MKNDEELLEGAFPCVGASDNARFYLLDPNILAVVPLPDTDDNGPTSLQSIRFQENFWRKRDSRGGCVVFMDRVLTQDRDARRNYQTKPNPRLFSGFALVTESVLGRAVSSMFVGLSAPAVPTKVFDSIGNAKAWLVTLHQDPTASTTHWSKLS